MPSLCFTGVNMVLFYLYQFRFFQNSSNTSTMENFGMIQLINATAVPSSSSESSLDIQFGSYEWPAWLHPAAVFLLFIALVRIDAIFLSFSCLSSSIFRAFSTTKFQRTHARFLARGLFRVRMFAVWLYHALQAPAQLRR